MRDESLLVIDGDLDLSIFSFLRAKVVRLGKRRSRSLLSALLFYLFMLVGYPHRHRTRGGLLFINA